MVKWAVRLLRGSRHERIRPRNQHARNGCRPAVRVVCEGESVKFRAWGLKKKSGGWVYDHWHGNSVPILFLSRSEARENCGADERVMRLSLDVREVVRER